MSADPGFPEFLSACRDLGVELTEAQHGRLVRYAALLRSWNTRINLVSRRDTGRVMTYHIVDSLAVQRLLPSGARICDVGTGAGLPGIPLAIVRSDLEVLLVESSQKRTAFLSAAVVELEVTNSKVIGSRAESLDPLDCDVVLSRLSGPLKDLLKHAARHRKPDGKIILYKTKESSAEANKLAPRYRLRAVETVDVVLPLTGIPRRFTVLGA
jgi:16S rRNA (guanine527-N7)-methyltransferase